MLPTKEGQIVKFHTPLKDENPDQQYVVLEIKDDSIKSRVDIQALNTGSSFSPINTVLLSDLEVIEVDTSDLIGHTVTVNKSDYSQVVGKVFKVREQKINLDLSKGIHGVETNVWLTILDDKGNEHMGTLYVTP